MSITRPLVTIAIPIYNAEKYIRYRSNKLFKILEI